MLRDRERRTTRSVSALLATFLPIACSDPTTPVPATVDPTAHTSARSQAAPAASTSAIATSAPEMTGYPWARLPAVEPIDVELDRKQLEALGVRSWRAFSTTTGVRLWLLVFEFATQQELLAAREKVSGLFGGARDNPPFYGATAATGGWLLVAGFPGSKPVSPQMDEAKKAALQRWSGEE